jgi:tetratricopeptide (TPR) repeat protein
MYQDVFGVLRPLDDRTQLTNVLLSYGELMSELGARTEADKALRESIDLSRAAGYDALVAGALGDLAWNTFGLGLVEQAEAEWRESTAIAERQGDTSTVVSGYKGLALVSAARGDMAGAVRTQEQAVRLAARSDPTLLATEQSWYAVHLLGVGQYARAADTALAAAAVLRDHHVERDELIAHAAAAFALARLDRRAGATAELALGRALLGHSLPVDYRAHAAEWLMRAAVQLGARDDARAILAAAPRDHVAVPWATALAAQAKRLGVTAP